MYAKEQLPFWFSTLHTGLEQPHKQQTPTFAQHVGLQKLVLDASEEGLHDLDTDVCYFVSGTKQCGPGQTKRTTA